MSTTTPTPSMNLLLPNVGQELGPQYAIDINAALTRIDSHTHLEGYGVPIVTAAINLNADLSFATGGAPVNAVSVRSVQFATQVSALSSPDLACAYSVGSNGDLYWNDLNGNQIALTANGQINITGTQLGIQGLVAPASAVYSPGSGTFTFQSDTGPNYAAMEHGPIVIHDTATGSNGILIQSPTSLAAGYNITLPTSLPASTLPMFLGPAGNGQISTAQISTPMLADGSVTAVKQANVIIQGGGVIAAASYTSPTPVSTSLTTPITIATLRPIMIALRAIEGSLLPGAISVSAGSAGGVMDFTASMYINVTGAMTTTIGYADFGSVIHATSGSLFQAIVSYIPVASVQAILIPTATGTLSLRLWASVNAGTILFNNLQLIAYQL